MPARATEGEMPPPAADERIELLLAEDDAEQRGRLHALLSEAGFAVSCATSGEEAITAYARVSVPMVLVDTDLPGLDGVEVCRRIRALDPAHRTFVLAFSRSDTLRRMLDAVDAGADDYFTQPEHADHLRARLEIARRRIALDDARRAAEAEAARARYLAGVGEMAIALQHEINNPLAAVLAHAELLAMEPGATSGEVHESLHTILEQARRIADVVRRLSSLRNPTSVEYVPGKRMVHLRMDEL